MPELSGLTASSQRSPGAHDAARSNRGETCGVQEDEKLPLSATPFDPDSSSGKRKLLVPVATQLSHYKPPANQLITVRLSNGMDIKAPSQIGRCNPS